MRLRTSLFLLSLATALPLVAFALLAAAFVVQHEYENLVSVANARNRAVLSAVDAELHGAINTLRAVAVIRSLGSDDLRTFHATAHEILATQPGWNNVLLHDSSGRQLVNASLPWGTPLLTEPVAPRSIETAVRTLEPAIDDLAPAPLLGGQLGVPVRVPVVRDGKTVYVLTAVIRPEAFQRVIGAQILPADWASGLVDRQGRLIARVPHRTPGTMASREYLDNVRKADEGWYRGATLDGTDTYTAFLRSELTGWSIGYAVPATHVLGGATQAAWLMGSGIGLSLAAAGVLGLWLIRRISQPMAELATAATAIGSGARPKTVRSTIVEIDSLSQAVGAAAAAIAARDHEIHRSAAELRQQTEALQVANANKSQFLALLAHELRNPLAPLRNGITLLRLQREPQRLAETQAMMERQVAHMARLIEDLLDVSRIDRGQLELRRERVAIDAVVASAIETAKPAIESKQQALVVRYERSALHVDGDPVRLSQVISNLLNNASKFTPPQGRIEIAITVEDAEAVIAVTDSGLGFRAEDSARIFELFVQLDASRAQAAGGLGIGLTLVRSIIALHGGTVTAHSDGAGKGARFTVRLPLAAVHEAAASQPVALRGATAQRRVLVVDDNADAATSLGEILRLQGFDVRTAFDGREALEVARDFHPEVAFLDLNMPTLSGAELAIALRKEPWAAALRLVALTGMGRAYDIELTRSAGFESHLTKPVAIDDILRVFTEPRENVVPLHGERRKA
jgi:signal transduction histidine kinase/ActR/RegA family two-component response regulator